MGASAMPINIGNTAFMLICASLVMLMTPGLAFFYGGLVGRKNVLTIMIQSFMSLGWTTVLWYVFGYSLCFGHFWDVGGSRPGSLSPHATDIFQEGLAVPQVRIVAEGRLNEDLYRTILRNSRFPEMLDRVKQAAVSKHRALTDEEFGALANTMVQ